MNKLILCAAIFGICSLNSFSNATLPDLLPEDDAVKMTWRNKYLNVSDAELDDLASRANLTNTLADLEDLNIALDEFLVEKLSAVLQNLNATDSAISGSDIRASKTLKLRYAMLKAKNATVTAMNEHRAQLVNGGYAHAATFSAEFHSVFAASELGGLFGLRETSYGRRLGEEKPQSRKMMKVRQNNRNMVDATDFSWVGSAVTTRVGDQGNCGGCWAFAASEVIGALNYIQNNVQSDLSPQQLISCDTTDGGCNGGNPINVWQKTLLYHGYSTTNEIVSNSEYPFDSSDGVASTCLSGYTRGSSTVSGTLAFTNVNVAVSSQALYEAVQEQPVSIGLYATPSCFMDYSGGIVFASQCSDMCQTSNHAVVVVGYGSWGTNDAYFIIKNSWGTGWGDAGYIKIAADDSACGGNGIFNMLSSATYPQFTQCVNCSASAIETEAPSTDSTTTSTPSPSINSAVDIRCLMATTLALIMLSIV